MLARILTSLTPARTIIEQTKDPKIRHPTKLKKAYRVAINNSDNRTCIIPLKTRALNLALGQELLPLF